MPEVKLAELNVGDKKTSRQYGLGGVPLLALGTPGEDDPTEPEDDEEDDNIPRRHFR